MIKIQSKNKFRTNNIIREKMININRVTKVIKGRRIMAFVALVVVGNGKGSIGMGKGKSKEIPIAVKKANEQARKTMYKIILNNGTIHYKIIGKHCASSILMLPAKDGVGVIAGGTIRAIFNVMGIINIVTKSNGSTNPYNMVKATINGLLKIKSPLLIASKRGKNINDII